MWGVKGLTVMKTVCAPWGSADGSSGLGRRPAPPPPAHCHRLCRQPLLRVAEGLSKAPPSPASEAWPAAFSAPPGLPPGLAR